MATFRVRFRLNSGRAGIAWGKLSRQSESIELFLRSLTADLGESDAPNLWIAKDFKNGSLLSTAEYQAVTEAANVARFNAAVRSLAEKPRPPRSKSATTKGRRIPTYVSAKTVDRFAALGNNLDADENVGIALFDEETERQRGWASVDRRQFEEIAREIETEVHFVGSVIGHTHEWNKGARDPYIIVRELNTGELIKCLYEDEDYSRVAKLFANKTSVVIVEGAATYNRLSNSTEITAARNFQIAPDFTDRDYEEFFGCAPDLTGNLSTAEFIDKSRSDG